MTPASANRISAVLAGLLLAVGMVLGQSPPAQTPQPEDASPAQPVEDTPEAAAARYGASLRQGDWKSCSQLMHSEALARFGELFVPIAIRDHTGKALQAFFQVTSAEELDQLAPEVRFERFFLGLSQVDPALQAQMENSEMTPIGHLMEGEVAHVVSRIRVVDPQGVKVQNLEVVSLKKEGDQWKILLPAPVEALAASIAGAIRVQP